MNGRVYTRLFDGSARTITSVSPEGRQTVTTLDALGRPASVHVGPLAPTTFGYDAAGRLQTRTQGARTTTMAYDGRGFLQSELDGAGTLVSRFVYGTRINVPEYLVKNRTTYRLVTDHLGSVRLVVDTSRP